MGIQGGTRCDMEGAVASAHSQGAGVFAMKALGGGHLIGSSREALSYILSQPWIDAVAVGMQSFAEIDANVRAFEGDFSLLEPLSSARAAFDGARLVRGLRALRGAVRPARHPRGGRTRARGSRKSACLCGYCAGVCPQVCIKVV